MVLKCVTENLTSSGKGESSRRAEMEFSGGSDYYLKN